jgi:hypothetical protein
MGTLNVCQIQIHWAGPFSLDEVIGQMKDAGKPPVYGNDYGLYQIYGRHVLHGKDCLLYVGITTEQTFSDRFKQHETWLKEDQEEDDIKIYLGRTYDPQRHSEKDGWTSWKRDVELSEKILIYKYSPNYNSEGLSVEPDLSPYSSVRLIHVGKRRRLRKEDNVPKDFREW